MVAITLPDGSVRDFDGPVTGVEIAHSIGPRLAKDALAAEVRSIWSETELLEVPFGSVPERVEFISRVALEAGRSATGPSG